ncbi:hypothetical protein H5T88_01735 [bacterium]|nr:hypothetical protein [bacterium]
MKKEVSPAVVIIIIIVVLAIIIFAFYKATAKRVKTPPPGVMPMPKAAPGAILPLPLFGSQNLTPPIVFTS